MISVRKIQLLGAAMTLVTTMAAGAQDYRRDGAPRDMVESSRQSGGYCDRGGCPDHFWKYRIFYGPVFYHGHWFRGPVYVKDDYGRNLFWVAGGWHRDEWHGPRPGWARAGYFGPPQSRDYYRSNNFGGGDRYADNGRQPGDRGGPGYRDNAPDQQRGYDGNGRYGADNGPSRDNGYAQNRQGYGGQDGRQQDQAANGNGQDQRYQYGNRNPQGGNWNNADRSANGGPTSFTNQPPSGHQPGQFAAQAPGQQQSSITVTSASYGQSCKAPKGNETAALQAACNGKASCQYTVDYRVIGDPAPTCSKDFAIEWTCSTGPGGSASLPAEATGGKLNLSCPARR